MKAWVFLLVLASPFAVGAILLSTNAVVDLTIGTPGVEGMMKSTPLNCAIGIIFLMAFIGFLRWAGGSRHN